MELHVVVTVDVVQRKSRRAKGLELGSNLTPELFSYPGAKKETQCSSHWTLQLAMRIDKIGYLAGCEHRDALTYCDVQTDTQARVAARTHDGIHCMRRADEQASRSQYPPLMRLFDRFIDWQGQSEVVARNDDTLAHGLTSVAWPE